MGTSTDNHYLIDLLKNKVQVWEETNYTRRGLVTVRMERLSATRIRRTVIKTVSIYA